MTPYEMLHVLQAIEYSALVRLVRDWYARRDFPDGNEFVKRLRADPVRMAVEAYMERRGL